MEGKTSTSAPNVAHVRPMQISSSVSSVQASNEVPSVQASGAVCSTQPTQAASDACSAQTSADDDVEWTSYQVDEDASSPDSTSKEQAVDFSKVLNIEPIDEANTVYKSVTVTINGVTKDVLVPMANSSEAENATIEAFGSTATSQVQQETDCIVDVEKVTETISIGRPSRPGSTKRRTGSYSPGEVIMIEPDDSDSEQLPEATTGHRQSQSPSVSTTVSQQAMDTSANQQVTLTMVKDAMGNSIPVQVLHGNQKDLSAAMVTLKAKMSKQNTATKPTIVTIAAKTKPQITTKHCSLPTNAAGGTYTLNIKTGASTLGAMKSILSGSAQTGKTIKPKPTTSYIPTTTTSVVNKRMMVAGPVQPKVTTVFPNTTPQIQPKLNLTNLKPGEKIPGFIGSDGKFYMQVNPQVLSNPTVQKTAQAPVARAPTPAKQQFVIVNPSQGDNKIPPAKDNSRALLNRLLAQSGVKLQAVRAPMVVSQSQPLSASNVITIGPKAATTSSQLGLCINSVYSLATPNVSQQSVLKSSVVKPITIAQQSVTMPSVVLPPATPAGTAALTFTSAGLKVQGSESITPKKKKVPTATLR